MTTNNRHKMKKCLLVLVLFCAGLSMWSQTVTVKGTVTSSEDGQPLSGVAVILDGTTNGTLTDLDGNWSLDVSGGGTLLFTCLGFEDRKEQIGDRSVINVTLSTNVTQLDELVVVGYGTVKKSDLTGAVSSVRGDELKKASVANVGAALQGKVAGVTVTSNTGQPGSDVSIRIRGIGSVNAGVSPLYVVDGMIVNDIGFLSPNDIASTEVLKDAASAAIYGSRAANGVILITTKSASRDEKTRITFEAYAGVQTRWRKLDLMSGQEQLETYLALNPVSSAEKEAYQTGGINGWLNFARLNGVDYYPVATDVPGQGFNYAAQNTDWQDEVFRDAWIQNYYLSVDSGGKKVQQTFSANWFSQDGTIIGSWYNRLNLHYNASTDIKKWLKLGTSLNFSSTRSRWALNNNSQPGASVLSAAMAMAPWDPVSYPAGSLNYLGEDLGGGLAAASMFTNVVNPYSMAVHSYPKGSTERFVGSINLELKPFKGFVFRSDFNFDLSYVHSRQYTEAYFHSPSDKNDTNSISQNQSRSASFNLNNYATYARSFGKHDFSIMAGQTIDISENESVGVGGRNLLHSGERFWSLAYATSDFTYGGSYNGQYRRMSFIGRVMYDYDDRYLFTFNWRSDGNRSFAEHPWGHFPSVAVAWKLSGENWMKEIENISLLKIRLGWGRLGNDSVDANLFTQTMDSSMYANLGYPFGPNGGDGDDQELATGAAVTSLKNRSGRWEISEHYNLGVDFGFFGDRLNGTLDLFIRDTKDMLLARTLPYYVGSLYTAMDNIGTMRNSGIELQLGWRDSFELGNNAFWYDISGNISFVKNEVTNMNGSSRIYGDKTVTDQGFAVNSFWGYTAEGIFRTQDEINEFFKIKPNPDNDPEIAAYNETRNVNHFEVGDIRYKDWNGDGELDEINDMKVIGNPFPKFSYGLNVNLGWGPVDLSMFFQGVYGNKIYNALRERLEGTGLNSQLSVAMRDVWTTDNPDGSIPNPLHSVNFWQSTRFLEDGSYLRLKNLQIGYTIPQRVLQRAKIQNFRIYLAASNLFTITKYSGYDPEVGGGVDYGNYPQSRTFMLGVNFTF